MMKALFATFCLLAMLSLPACDHDDTPDPSTKADIIGSVRLYNEGTGRLPDEGMRVTLEGVDPTISALTDVDGKFTLADVPFGTYTLLYEKAGFGTYRQFNLQHANTGGPTILATTPSLGQSSTTAVTALSSGTNGTDVLLSITTDPAGSIGTTRYVRYFLSASPTVSATDYTFSSPGLVAQINPYTSTLTRMALQQAGFAVGQTVYAMAYGDSFWSNAYDDPGLGRNVFPNLNAMTAGAVSFVVP